jgi:hypothetical protein
VGNITSINREDSSALRDVLEGVNQQDKTLTELEQLKAAKTKDELLSVCATQYYDYDVNAEMSQ